MKVVTIVVEVEVEDDYQTSIPDALVGEFEEAVARKGLYLHSSSWEETD